MTHESNPDPAIHSRGIPPILTLCVLFISGLFIYGYRLGDSPLDRTEPFRALVADQMVKGGSWLLPRMYGELYLRKPPLIYWIEAITQHIVGHGGEWVWRLPSVLGSALLAVFVAWWTGRWFSSKAILPAGFACLALVGLWDQNRSADIDALNTVAAVLSTLCVLELVCGTGRWRLGWAMGLGVSLGAALLLKGPGALPQVLAGMVGPAIFFRDWKAIRKPLIWLGILIGFAIFTAYVVAAKSAMSRAGLTPDHTGWYEVIEKIFLHGWLRRLKAFLTPLTLVIYALPVSIVLPFAIVLVRKMPIDAVNRKRVISILATLAVAATVWLIDGNDNPRYEYVMLPLLAPLVGFAWCHWTSERQLRPVLIGICFLFFGAIAAISIKLPHAGNDFTLGMIAMSLGLMAVVTALFKPQVTSYALVLLLLLTAIPMGERKNAERRRKSASNASAQLRQIIGDAPRVATAGVVRDMPELFYYANVDVDSYGEFGLPKLANTRGGHWVVLGDTKAYPAMSTLSRQVAGAFPKGVTRLKMPEPSDVIYVGWYDPPAGANTHVDWHVVKQTESDD